MRSFLLGSALIGATIALTGCANKHATEWGDAVTIASGQIEQTAMAAIPAGPLAMWSRIVTSDEIDTDQNGLDNAVETRYRVYGQLILESSHRQSGSSWSDAQSLQSGARVWLRTEDRDNATGKVTTLRGASDVAMTSGLRIAHAQTGTAFAIWRQFDSYTSANQTTRIVSRVYSAIYDTTNEQWSTPVALNAITAPATLNTILAGDPLEAFDPDIATDGADNALAVWRQSDTVGGPSTVVARRYRSLDSWKTTQTISNAASGHDADAPRVAMQTDGNGNGFAVWRQHLTSTHNAANLDRHVVYAARYASAAWSTPAPLSDALAEATLPVIAANSNGKAVAAWQQTDYTLDGSNNVVISATTSVYANRYTNAVWLATAEEIDTSSTRSARAITVAMDNSDRVHTAWLQQIAPTSAGIWNNNIQTVLLGKYYYTYWDGSNYVSTWSAAQTIDGDTRFDTDTPNLLSNGSDVLLYWRRWREPRGTPGSGHDILAIVNGGATQVLSDAEDAYGASAAFGADSTLYIGWGSSPATGDGKVIVRAYE